VTRVHLVSFADGGAGYLAGRDLLIQTAREAGWFESITAYDLNRLAHESPVWFAKHQGFIKANRRGFGYWIWKPEVIRLKLHQVPPDDLVLYLDAGCQINPKGISRFNRYIELAKRSGMLCFYLNGSNYTIGQWTKANLLRHFEIKLGDPILSMPQVEAGVSFYKHSKSTLNLVKLWSDILCLENHHFVDDSPSRAVESQQFIEHRHDQSVFSLIHYMYRWGTSIRNENYFPIYWKNNIHPKNFPIAATRYINPNRTNLLALKPT
jgi:hypothetical protein